MSSNTHPVQLKRCGAEWGWQGEGFAPNSLIYESPVFPKTCIYLDKSFRQKVMNRAQSRCIFEWLCCPGSETI